MTGRISNKLQHIRPSACSYKQMAAVKENKFLSFVGTKLRAATVKDGLGHTERLLAGNTCWWSRRNRRALERLSGGDVHFVSTTHISLFWSNRSLSDRNVNHVTA